MSTPFFGLYPLFRPKRIILMVYVGGVTDFVRINGLHGGSPVEAIPPDYGRLIIHVNVQNSGYFGYKNFNSDAGTFNGGAWFNGGNALSANVWYKFEIPAVPSNQNYVFFWQSSSSSVSSTLIELVVIWEPTEVPPSAGATD